MRMLKHNLILISVFLLFSCQSDELKSETEELETPDWTDATHSNLVSPDYSAVFAQNEVLRFDIEIDEENWTTIQDDLDDILKSVKGQQGSDLSDYDPVWVPCSLNFNGKEWYKVGIRYKGNSSLQNTYKMVIEKFSFKLDFDQFEDDYPAIENQRFYGFKQLNLKNNYLDLSHMREKVGSDLFADFGLASPQTAFCVLYVDYGSGPVYFGVYTLVEEVDETVLDDWFESDDGNLYKPDGDAASFANGTYNEEEMEKKNNEDQADYSDVYQLYTILNSSARSSDVDQWCADLEQILNVDVFLKWLAANIAMQNWDTYGKMTHNYYLYNNPENNLLTWIPWDNNEALETGKQGGALCLELDDVNNSWPLIRYLIDIPEYKTKYQKYLKEFTEDVFNPDRMETLYSNYYNLLKDDVYNEISGYTFLSSDDDFDQAVEELKKHVEERENEVFNYLK